MWSIAAGTRRGPHHRARGEDNQDAWSVGQHPSGTLVLAVADGAGSLASAGAGARLATAAAISSALATLDEFPTGPRRAVVAATEAATAAVLAQPRPHDHGCTLVVAAASAHGWAASVVGDSFLVVTHDNGTHELVRPAPAGEYVNITKLLTSVEQGQLIASGSEEPVALTAASDGLAHASLSPAGPHRGFYTPLVQQASAGNLNITELLAHMDRNGLLDDDATIVCTTRPS